MAARSIRRHKGGHMKQLTIVLDGIADRPQQKLEGKSPMEAAKTPGLDALCAAGKAGTVRTIPQGLEIGSAVANLSLLGYDPAGTYKGRAVIEAAGAGLAVKQGALYVRCNFVTLEGQSFEQSVMQSYSAHDIETPKARPLTQRLNEEVFGGAAQLIHTDTFRNILVVDGAAREAEQLLFTPAHEMIGDKLAEHLHGSAAMQPYFDMLRKAYEVLSKDNDTKANGIWFWGASYAPHFGPPPPGRRVILAETTLMRGIAALLHTDCVSTAEDAGFEQYLKDKTADAIHALEEYDYAYIHIQKLDDLSHELMPKEKAHAIEMIDSFFIQPFFAQIRMPCSAMIVSDHYTFSDSGGHGAEPAPFLLLGHGADGNAGRFTEPCCRETGFDLTAPQLVAIQRGEG